MVASVRWLATLCAAAGLACAEAATEPGGGQFPLAGRYTAIASGTTDGVDLAADVGFEIEHDAGVLSGTFGIVGTLTDGELLVEIIGYGGLAGTASTAELPLVTLTARTDVCPEHSVTFVGTFYPANGLLRLAGPIDILGSSCEVGISFEVLLELRQ